MNSTTVRPTAAHKLLWQRRMKLAEAYEYRNQILHGDETSRFELQKRSASRTVYVNSAGDEVTFDRVSPRIALVTAWKAL